MGQGGEGEVSAHCDPELQAAHQLPGAALPPPMDVPGRTAARPSAGSVGQKRATPLVPMDCWGRRKMQISDF